MRKAMYCGICALAIVTLSSAGSAQCLWNNGAYGIYPANLNQPVLIGTSNPDWPGGKLIVENGDFYSRGFSELTGGVYVEGGLDVAEGLLHAGNGVDFTGGLVYIEGGLDVADGDVNVNGGITGAAAKFTQKLVVPQGPDFPANPEIGQIFLRRWKTCPTCNEIQQIFIYLQFGWTALHQE